MAAQWKTAHCTERVPELDTESSPTTVYRRKDFEQVPWETEGQDPIQIWKFQQQEISREEWDQMNSLTTQQTMQALNDLKADVAFLAL